MNIAVFHGSPREGNTAIAANIFLDELRKCGGANVTEFRLPKDLPVFCTGCALCLGGMRDKCPNALYRAPIVSAIRGADALVFATPHYGACAMPGSMKSLLDHIDFMVLNVDPMPEMFEKKAFLITTGAGSASAAKPIKSFLKHCGINRCFSLGIRMFTNAWDKMPKAKRERSEQKLRKAARKFYRAKKGRPYLSTVLFYHIVKSIIIKRMIGEGHFSYDNWKAKGYFDKRPF